MFEQRLGASAGSGTAMLSAPPGRAEPPEPGPELVAALLATPVAERSAAGRIEAIVGWERVIAWAQAQQVAELAAFAAEHPSALEARPPALAPVEAQERWESDRGAAEEISAALRVASSTARNRLFLAVELTSRLPEAHAALAAGKVTLPQARLLADATAVLDEGTARRVVAELLPTAQTSTWGQLNARVHKAVLAADPRAAEERHQQAAVERRVVLSPQPDGMAWLSLYTTADAAMTGWIAATALAHAAKSSDPLDGRGLDARRADALADLFTAALDDPTLPTEQRTRPQLRVVVPVGTLLGESGEPGTVSEEPGMLAGYGPIPASLTRKLAADADWRRILTDPASGALLDVGTTSYRPPAALAEFVLTRDATCRFPSCRMPAHRCDLDHTRRFPDGPTAAGNLGPECEPHHLGKHRGGWTLTQPVPGRFEWTSPTGHTYVVSAEPLGPIGPPEPPPEPPPPDDGPPPF